MKIGYYLIMIFVLFFLIGCSDSNEKTKTDIDIEKTLSNHKYPKIASWLAKKDDIILQCESSCKKVGHK